MIGLGVKIHYLGGGSEHDPAKFYGRKIKKAFIENDKFVIEFTDKSQISIWDNGQSCCENRYMTCDDEPSSLKGGKLINIEVKKHEDSENDWGEVHEECFVEIATDKKGFITLVNHNQHNGYYGGFGLTVTLDVPGKKDLETSKPEF